MAGETVQQASLMPFSGEIGLAQYINQLFGGNTGQITNLALAPTPTQLTTEQLAEYTPEQLSQLMTEYMRGAGNFLGAAREQNLSGLYNTATRNLVSNDIMAQAALKATQANTAVKTANANLANQTQNANAQIASQVALQNARTQNEVNLANAKLKAATPSTGVLGGALGIAALGALLNKTGVGSKIKKDTTGILDSILGTNLSDVGGVTRDDRVAGMMEMASQELAWLQSGGGVDTTPMPTDSFDLSSIGGFSTLPSNYESDFAASQFAGLTPGEQVPDFLSAFSGWAPSYSGYDEGTGYGTSIANYDLPSIGGGYDFAWDTTQPTYDLGSVGDWASNLASNAFDFSNFNFSWG